MRLSGRKLIIPVLLLLVIVLAGCGNIGQQKMWREKAEQHLAKLQSKVGGADSFTLQSGKPEAPDKSTHVLFKVDSAAYGDSFRILVSRDGAESIDTYYRLYLKEDAEEKINALLQKALASGFPADNSVADKVRAEVGFLIPSEASVISLHAADTADELLEKTEDTIVLDIRIRYSGGRNMNSLEVDAVLCTLQEEGINCKLYPYQSDAVWYELINGKCWETRQTGADGGAMMQRGEYFPSVPASGS